MRSAQDSMPTGSSGARWARLAVLLLIATQACSPAGGEDEADATASEDAEESAAAVPVDVATVTLGDVQRLVRASTTLEARNVVTVSPRTAGVVVRLGPQVGDVVQSGAEIAGLSDPQLPIAIDGARTQVGRLRDEVERMRPLVEQGYLPRVQLEQAEASLLDAQNALERVQAQQADLTVRAPILGVVIERGVELGELVAPSQSLFEIAEMSSLVAPALVPERELEWLRVGQTAELVVDALAGREVAATVGRIDPVVDPRTGTVRIELTIDPATIASEGLRPGMFVRAAIEVERRSGVTVIPKRAITYEADTAWVHRLGEASEGSGGAEVFAVERVRIETGFEDGDRIEAVGALGAGDRVIVAGQAGLDEDSVVSIVPGVAGEGSAEGSAGAP